jgi:myosin heavy subunit
MSALQSAKKKLSLASMKKGVKELGQKAYRAGRVLVTGQFQGEIIVTGERVRLDEEGFNPGDESEITSFKTKYFPKLMDDETQLETVKSVFKMIFNIDRSDDQIKLPCDDQEQEILLDGLTTRRETLWMELKNLYEMRGTAALLRTKLQIYERLNILIMNLQRDEDLGICQDYNPDGTPAGFRKINLEDENNMRELLRNFVFLILQAKMPVEEFSDTTNTARELVTTINENKISENEMDTYLSLWREQAAFANENIPNIIAEVLEGVDAQPGLVNILVDDQLNSLYKEIVKEAIINYEASVSYLIPEFNEFLKEIIDNSFKDKVIAVIKWILTKNIACTQTLEELKKQEKEITAKISEQLDTLNTQQQKLGELQGELLEKTSQISDLERTNKETNIELASSRENISNLENFVRQLEEQKVRILNAASEEKKCKEVLNEQIKRHQEISQSLQSAQLATVGTSGAVDGVRTVASFFTQDSPAPANPAAANAASVFSRAPPGAPAANVFSRPPPGAPDAAAAPAALPAAPADAAALPAAPADAAAPDALPAAPADAAALPAAPDAPAAPPAPPGAPPGAPSARPPYPVVNAASFFANPPGAPQGGGGTPEEEIAKLTGTVNLLQEELSQIQQTKASCLEAAKADVQLLEKTITDYERTNRELSLSLSEKQVELEKIRQSSESNTLELEEQIKNTLEHIKFTNASFEEQKQRFKDKESEQREQIAKLEESSKNFEREKQSAELEITRLTEQLDEESKLNEISKQKQLEELSKQETYYTSVLTKLNTDIQQLDSAKTAAEKLAESLKESNEFYDEDNDRLQKENVTIRTENRKILAEIVAMSQAIEEGKLYTIPLTLSENITTPFTELYQKIRAVKSNTSIQSLPTLCLLSYIVKTILRQIAYTSPIAQEIFLELVEVSRRIMNTPTKQSLLEMINMLFTMIQFTYKYMNFAKNKIQKITVIKSNPTYIALFKQIYNEFKKLGKNSKIFDINRTLYLTKLLFSMNDNIQKEAEIYYHLPIDNPNVPNELQDNINFIIRRFDIFSDDATDMQSFIVLDANTLNMPVEKQIKDDIVPFFSPIYNEIHKDQTLSITSLTALFIIYSMEYLKLAKDDINKEKCVLDFASQRYSTSFE